jgi:hypothetical protein
MTPLMVMVGADKGGVGKTTVSRAAIDYIAARGARPRVYDTEHPTGGLARFPFAGAEVVDLSRISGKVKVFDAVDTNPVTLIDMRAGLMSATLRALEEAGLLGAVRAREINLALLHVLGPTPESLAEVVAATKLIGDGGARHFVVKNNILAQADGDDVFADWATRPEYAGIFRSMEQATITVPRLPEEITREVHRQAASFAAFAGDPANGRTKRGLVHAWMRAIWADMDKTGLDELVGAAAQAAAS